MVGKEYDPTLFKGTAPYYSTFRASYPSQLFEDIKEQFGSDHSGIALDLGCGTGNLSFGLAKYFHRVVAMDPDPEMIAEAKRIARKEKIVNIDFRIGSSWDVTPELGSFQVTTMGESFHWMDRDQILSIVYNLSTKNGGVVIISKKEVGPPGYKETIDQVIQKYLGSKRRAGKGFYEHPKERHEEILSRSKFTVVEPRHYVYPIERDIRGIIGFLYSTSYANINLLQDRRDSFEQEITQSLLHFDPSGKYPFSMEVQALIGVKK